jgi:hypothetical protein
MKPNIRVRIEVKLSVAACLWPACWVIVTIATLLLT